MSTLPSDETLSVHNVGNDVVKARVDNENSAEAVDVEAAAPQEGKASEAVSVDEASIAIEGAAIIFPEIAEKDKAISRLEGQVVEANDRHLRLLAEFDNYKKNMAKQRAELLKYQGQAIISDLLTALDTFDYALAASEGSETSSFREGVVMIQKNFLDTLERWGIKGESALGKPFDPALHAALSTVEHTEYAPGTVAVEYKKAFYYKDRLLRHAEVVVAKEPVKDDET